jgi:hypothetical protein
MISHQHMEAISTTKQEAKWKQSGSKVEAKWMQMEATAWNMLEGMVLPLRHFCHWVANLRDFCHWVADREIIATNSKTASRRDRRRNHGRLVNSSQSVIGKVMTQPICHHFCHHLPLLRKVYIAGHLGLISLSPLMYYFTFMQATKQPDT